MRVQVAATFVCCLLVGVSLCQAGWPWEKKKEQQQQQQQQQPQQKIEAEVKPVAVETTKTTPDNNGMDEIKTLTLTKNGDANYGFRLANVKQSLLVAEVTPEGAADRAGLKFGDQVLTVNDKTPMGRQSTRVHEWLSTLNTLVLTYKPAPYNRRIKIVKKPGEESYGFEVDDEAEVDMVYSDTPAVRSGLMTDHVILSVNGEPTGGVGGVVEDLVPKAPDNQIVLEVMPSNFYFPIKKNVNFETISDDDDTFEYGTDQSGGEGGLGSLISSGIGGAAGSVLGSEIINVDSEQPEAAENEETEEDDDQGADDDDYGYDEE